MNSAELANPFPNVDVPVSKKSRKNLVIGVALVAVVLMLVGVGAAARLAQEPKPEEETQAATGVTEPNASTNPNQALIDIANNATETISPWGHSDDVLAQEPQLPTTQTLHAQYQRVREAISDRDYQTFRGLVSTELTWNMDTPKKLIGVSQTGYAAYQLLNKNAQENFEKQAPYTLSYLSPQINDITPVLVARDLEEYKDIQFYLVDPITKTAQIVLPTTWKYRIMLDYQIKNTASRTGTGKAFFVYDQQKQAWLFLGDLWDITAKNDTPPQTEATHTIQLAQDGTCTPSTLAIQQGDTVSWSPFKGMIYTTQTTGEHWNSTQLVNEPFSYTFSTPGKYTYIAQTPPAIEITNTCMIEVQ